MDSDSVKKAIIKQILIESNTANARQLMEVRMSPRALRLLQEAKLMEFCFRKSTTTASTSA